MAHGKIRAIVYGVGTMGKMATRYLIEKGVCIVGAIDANPELAGKDLGIAAGMNRKLNVTISTDPDAVLARCDADIALVSIYSQMDRMYPILRKCIEYNLNVITPTEEALYPWRVAPALASELDTLAKKHGVTLLGTGSQDSFRLNAISMLTGSCKSIESITLRQVVDKSMSGHSSLINYHVGEEKEAASRKIKEQGLELNSLRICLEAIIADLGLTIRHVEVTAEVLTADTDLKIMGIEGGIVKKGLVTGMAKITDIATKEGVHLRGEQISRVFTEQEKMEGGLSECYIKGVPELHYKMFVKDIEQKSSSVMSLINRIPDVINSAPGYVTAEQLCTNKLKYRAFPLHHYLNAYEGVLHG